MSYISKLLCAISISTVLISGCFNDQRKETTDHELVKVQAKTVHTNLGSSGTSILDGPLPPVSIKTCAKLLDSNLPVGEYPSEEAMISEIGEYIVSGDHLKAYIGALPFAREGAASSESLVGHYLFACGYYAEGWRYLVSAGEKGEVSAQHDLGLIFEAGVYVAKDTDKAIEWFIRAADQNLVFSQEKLATLFLIKEDYAMAYTYAHLAANSGSEEGMRILAGLYRFGAGVDKDVGKADFWRKQLKNR